MSRAARGLHPHCAFLFQRRGTAVVGKSFGPVMLVWFVYLAAVGVYRVMQHPQVLRALSPEWAWTLVQMHPAMAFTILGAVILALTGTGTGMEALYAGISATSGVRPFASRGSSSCFRRSSFGYFGQASTMLFQPGSAKQPFFYAAPSWALIPTVLIALLATVIASQAVISGAFSMTSQAIELGFLPRLRVIETSKAHRGQVFVPVVNAVLFAAVMFLVFGFRSSERLTSAYGIAVGLTMLITTVQMVSLSRTVWRWPWLAVVAISAPLFIIDALLVAANLHKVPQSGWFPVAVGIVLFVLMATWHRGREFAIHHASQTSPLADYLRNKLHAADAPACVPGTAVYPGSTPGATPSALLSNMRHNRVLHQTVIVFANHSDS